jgi:hypothetical protein
MAELASRYLGSEAARKWAYAAALALVGGAAAVLPTATRLSRSLRELETTRRTYAARVAWAGKRDEIEQRLRDQEAGAKAVDAKLLTAGDLSSFAQALTVAARAAGCSVQSVRPAEPRLVPRPDAEASKAAGKGAPRVEWVEWPVRLILQGDYPQISALLDRLRGQERFLRVTRLSLQPVEDDREQLSCELEIAGYGLRPSSESPGQAGGGRE